ncbi:MAG: phosphatase PAP2 family protein [Oscillospiraceae bacterium]
MPDFIQAADWAVLHWIRENLSLRSLRLSYAQAHPSGEGGAVWIVAGLALTASKKYRKHGICLLLALLAGLLICNIGLKNIVARPRPCWQEAVDLLAKNPRDYSFPSGHTWSAVTGAWVITAANRKFGWWAIPGRSPGLFPGCICSCISHRIFFPAPLSVWHWVLPPWAEPQAAGQNPPRLYEKEADRLLKGPAELAACRLQTFCRKKTQRLF